MAEAWEQLCPLFATPSRLGREEFAEELRVLGAEEPEATGHLGSDHCLVVKTTRGPFTLQDTKGVSHEMGRFKVSLKLRFR